MIYIQTGNKIHTDGQQSAFNFNQYLSDKTPILKKAY